MLSAMNVLLLLPLFKAIPFAALIPIRAMERSEEHTSELQSQSNLVCRLLLEKKKHQIHSSLVDEIDRQAKLFMETKSPPHFDLLGHHHILRHRNIAAQTQLNQYATRSARL